jgi:ABC-type transport system substrate-binding protein
MEMAQYFNYIYKTEGDYDLNLHVMTAGVEPDEWLTCYFSRKSTAYKWNNPEIWRLCADQARTLDKEKRVAIIHEAQRKILADIPYVFLKTHTRFTAMRPYVHRVLYYNEYQPLLGENLWMDEH